MADVELVLNIATNVPKMLKRKPFRNISEVTDWRADNVTALAYMQCLMEQGLYVEAVYVREIEPRKLIVLLRPREYVKGPVDQAKFYELRRAALKLLGM